MVTTYKLNTRELESTFIDSIKTAYPDRDIKILVKEQKPELDETEYLMSTPANRERLEEAIRDIEEGKNLVSFDSVEDLMKAAAEYRKKQ